MDVLAKKFAHEICNHVFSEYKPKFLSMNLWLKKKLIDAPSIYNQQCKYIVNYYLAHSGENIEKYYVKWNGQFDQNTFKNTATKLIQISSRHHQCSDVFYRLCSQLAILGVIYYYKGCSAGLSLAIQEITPLANEAYFRCDLDEKHDHLYNFAYDVLEHVFKWAERKSHFNKNLERLDFDCGEINYYATYFEYFTAIVSKEGKNFLNIFSAMDKNINPLTREVFVFRINDCCDDYYRKLSRMGIVKLRYVFLDTCMHISLITLHFFELLYPSDIKLAHESILRLAVLSARFGIITAGQPSKVGKQDLVTIS